MKRLNRNSKSTLLLLVSALMTLACVEARSQTLVHHWPFDGDLTDSAGSAAGTKQGAGGATYAPGQHGQALSFDGVDDYISTSAGTIVPATNYTLMAWVSWNGSTTRSYIAGGQNGGALGEVFTLGRTNGDTKLFLNLLASGGQGNSIAESDDGTLATDGSWMHVTYTVSSTGGTTLYLNGTSVGTNATRTTHDPDDTFNIGGTNPSGTPTNFMDGLIDDVAIFNGVLTEDQIGNAMNGGAPNFLIDSTAPSITATNPNGTADAYPGTDLIATFSEPIALSGGGTITVTDTDDGTGTVAISLPDPARVSASGLNLIIDLSTSLEFATNYEVTISGGAIEDSATEPNPYPGTTSEQWTFTTADEDLSAPVIILKSPADNAIGVAVGNDIVATYDDDILAVSGNIVLKDLLDGSTTRTIPVTDTSQASVSGKTLTINPSTPLAPGRPYAVQVAEGAVKNFSDVPFVGIPTTDVTTWNFHTQATPPNVIIFLADDLGLTDVQQHPTYFPDGSPLFETPNIHRLASEGMRFSQAYAQPLCSASRACLLSGQDTAAREKLYMAIVGSSVANPSLPSTSAPSSPYNHPTDRNHLPLAIETIAERLKAAGYATWHAGKWHLSPSSGDSSYYPDKQGFDKQLSVGGSGPSSYFGPFGGIPNMVDHTGAPALGSTGDHIADHMQKLVQDLIDDHLTTSPDQPFFLYYPAYSVHGPYEAKKSLFNYYQNKLAGLPDSKHQHPVMAAIIDMADRELGSMMDYLDDKGLSDNTLFIFVSDNGGLSIEQTSGFLFDDIGTDGIPDDDPSNTVNGNYAKTTAPIAASTRLTAMDPRRAGKGSLFEGGLRIPMIIRYPNGGLPTDTSTDAPVHLTDIYRTILDYTPAEALPGQILDGLSLKPVLEQSAALPERDIIIHFPRDNETWGARFLSKGYPDPDNYPFDVYPGGTAVIRYPYKMIARYSTAHDAATVDYQLFRLDSDEGEETNVAGQYPETVDAMRERLGAYYQATGALVPTPNPNYDGTSVDLPEITAKAYLENAGLTPNTPESFLLADPDLDGRRNEAEFLEQTDPDASDTARATIWLYDNGSFDELRFAIPANADQAAFQILDSSGAVAFTSSSGLDLDAQYGPFYVYKPTSPQPGSLPANYHTALAPPVSAPSVTPDSDGDLLPDEYESSNGLNPDDPLDGETDNDGDGFTRGKEYLAGTSDFDSNDRFRLGIDGLDTISPTINFDVRDQKAYRLHKSGDLLNWTLWEDFGVVDGDHNVALPLTPEADREFFKLEAYPP